MTENDENVVHYVTQEGQPYGSESRKCDLCGIMVWPRIQGDKTPLHTDDRAQATCRPY